MGEWALAIALGYRLRQGGDAKERTPRRCGILCRFDMYVLQ